ncbi:MAG: 4-hydroxy-3-methylbut-2-enyl diphosphate reductase [Cyclobacteriaceae bacterium]|nr:MAG: 4-hydroxy-3-methylbut-2-enyl diphosphate reductase [Cyclobacteriaceae bacterium]
MQVKLAKPRSFCAGVVRAIEIVERSLEIYGPPVYVLHEIVHNNYVVDALRAKGAVFVESMESIPTGEKVVFSAHGVAKQRVNEAKERGLQVLDATCPLVTKVHLEVGKYAREGKEVVLIGHQGHVEVIGTLGQYDTTEGGLMYLVQTVQDVDNLQVKDPSRLGYVTQTTLSVFDTEKIVKALKKKYPLITGPSSDDICYATQNRQQAVVKLAEEVDVLLVVGTETSSNSNRLREVGEQHGVKSYLIPGPEDIQPHWLSTDSVVGVTAGASAPEILVDGVLARLRDLGAESVTEIPAENERITFPLPKPLRRVKGQSNH